MSIKEDQAEIFDALRDESPCTVAHRDNVYRGWWRFDFTDRATMLRAGYDSDEADAWIGLKVSEFDGPPPEPRESIFVNGNEYKIGSGIQKSQVHWVIPLRRIN